MIQVNPQIAYSKYEIEVESDTYVLVFWETNDNLDIGYPSQRAYDTYHFDGPDALKKALKHTGKSRQGIRHRVYVTLDGKVI